GLLVFAQGPDASLDVVRCDRARGPTQRRGLPLCPNRPRPLRCAQRRALLAPVATQVGDASARRRRPPCASELWNPTPATATHSHQDSTHGRVCQHAAACPAPGYLRRTRGLCPRLRRRTLALAAPVWSAWRGQESLCPPRTRQPSLLDQRPSDAPGHL